MVRQASMTLDRAVDTILLNIPKRGGIDYKVMVKGSINGGQEIPVAKFAPPYATKG
jgi:hypothetical protein